MASGLLRAFETFASQRHGTTPTVLDIDADSGGLDSNVILPVYAAFQVAARRCDWESLAGSSHSSWMRHFVGGSVPAGFGPASAGEFFVTQGTGGVR